MNKFKLQSNDLLGPMVYPLWVENGNKLRDYMIKNKVFIAKYWPKILNIKGISSLEKDFVENIIALPIDQRYGENEMNYIIKSIKEYDY